MKQCIPTVVAVGLFFGPVWGKDCTLSSEFQLTHHQLLAGILEDPATAKLPGFELDLVAGGNIKGNAVTDDNGECSFGEVPSGRYRIRIRHSGDPFCAPTVKCNETGCSTQRQARLNPRNKPVIVY